MNICFLDFETSGIDVFKDYPIELGAVLTTENLEVIDTFHSFFKPRSKRDISKRAQNIHGLSYEQLIDSPEQKEVLSNFFTQFGTDYKFACWNMNFDITFFRRICHLNNEMVNFNRIFYRHIDLQSISSFLVSRGKINLQKASLDEMCNLFNLDRKHNHSALEDAFLNHEIYKKLSSMKL